MLAFLLVLGAPRRRRLRLALAEHGLRFFQLGLDFCCDWMRTAENAPRGLFRVLKRRHGLTEIVDCGAVVGVEGPCVIRPQRERDVITLAKNASRHGYRLAQHRLGFLVAF